MKKMIGETMSETEHLGGGKPPKREGKNVKNGIKREGKEETEILPALVNALKNDLGSALEKIEVKDIRIGLAYTGVLLSNGYGGVACTPLYEFSCCPALGFAGFLKGKTADKLLEFALSENPLEAAIGIATANALSHMLWDLKPENFPISNLDALDLIKPEDRVAMVGYFGPLVQKILKVTNTLTDLEKREIEAPQTKSLPSGKDREIFPV